jgi:hypothetical protein
MIQSWFILILFKSSYIIPYIYSYKSTLEDLLITNLRYFKLSRGSELAWKWTQPLGVVLRYGAGIRGKLPLIFNWLFHADQNISKLVCANLSPSFCWNDWNLYTIVFAFIYCQGKVRICIWSYFVYRAILINFPNLIKISRKWHKRSSKY